ncbi:MAG: undecaprenyl/decaprenyl-phosphate alpha-N-acetylglucosaminyl 1-phosphate transferase [Planctomycetota bacterium]|nr:undecaprenyl/decaprenyl-phosphate alpha-N-acetylglucosaminyl 1-phosphate transferase [Planctomycetaceae bacterium]MDQ3329945.1 undecaprenyl/decaprenyl-phosphate alpha-N-acetylglucosaminyl 1-phosphate transferase [Planctomycetota bacterium]
MQLPQFSTALIALALSAILTPLVMLLMTRIGLVDHPDGRRKLHRRVVPVAGGLAVWLAVVAALALAPVTGGIAIPWGEDRFWPAFLLSSFLLCLVGLADDAWNLRGRHKLFGQIAAVSVLLASGLVVHSVQLFGFHIHLGVLAIPFTLFWLLGAVNAMNLIDGMDGLAATVGGMIGLSLSVMASMNGHPEESAVAAALVGGIVGFLIYNFPPARVFMGDTGSMVIGLILGVVAVKASIKGPATIALAAPVAIWTLPILDASMAILRRKLTGRSILIPDRAHLHHRLSERGLGPRNSLLLVASLCGVTTAGALASMSYRAEWLAPAVALGVTAFLAATRLFGHSEFALLARRTRSFAQTMVPFRPVGNREHRSRLQGTKEWDRLWESLVTFADSCGLDSVQLAVSLPSLHEEFFAGWDRRFTVGGGRLYRADIPLSSPGHGSIGSLRIAGRCVDESACGWMGELIEGLRPFETQIAELFASGAVVQTQFANGSPPAWAGPERRAAVRRRTSLTVPAFATARAGFDTSNDMDAL